MIKKWEVCSIDRGRVFKFSKELKSDDMVLSDFTDRQETLFVNIHIYMIASCLM